MKLRAGRDGDDPVMGRIGQRFYDFYWGQGIADDVPALTYYLLLSLAPFALGVAALEAFLLEDLLGDRDRLAAQPLPPRRRALRHRAARDRHARQLAVAAALAIAAMLWTSSGAIGVIERCESRMLDCRRHGVFIGRLRNLALGALVAISFVFAAAGAPVIGDVLQRVSLGGTATTIAFNTLGSIVVFAVIYRYAPRSRMDWRAAFIGAVPAGIALQAIPFLIGLYFEAAAGFAAVRLFLLLAVLLLGLYVMATVMLVRRGGRGEGGAPRARVQAPAPAGRPRRSAASSAPRPRARRRASRRAPRTPAPARARADAARPRRPAAASAGRSSTRRRTSTRRAGSPAMRSR